MSKKNKNEKIEVSSGSNLNEKDYLNICLAELKEMEKNLCTALTEASNDNLFKSINKMFTDIVLLQRKVYEIMFRSGWYELECVESKKINEKYNTLLKDFESLNE